MSGSVTIVMYHYVRDLRRSRYPEIKGLSTSEFEEQIQYIKKHYTVISGPDLMAAAAGAPLPPRSLVLTFDDGYLDHFTQVFPILDREQLPGCFFPPAKCILEHQVLDVNKIHFVLASAPDTRALVKHIFGAIEANRSRYELCAPEVYWERFAKSSRFDPAEIIFCKYMLQRELPLDLRREIVDALFAQYVTRDDESFSKELYMSLDQIRTLHRHGMYIGSHGYDHFWLDSLSVPQQEVEIDRSLDFLRSVGADVQRWIMCYPYGAYNESLLSVIKSRHGVVGLTTEVGLASFSTTDPLVLPRLDTNDLPKESGAGMNEWTAQALS